MSLLHGAYAVLGVEYQYLCARNVLEAFESSLACVARSSNEDNYLLVEIYLLYGSCKEVGEYLERHILERAGRAVPQLKHICTVKKLCYLGNALCIEVLGAVSIVGTVVYLSLGKVCEKLTENVSRSVGILHACDLLYLVKGKGGYRLGDEKTAVFRNTLSYRLSTLDLDTAVSRTLIKHTFLLFCHIRQIFFVFRQNLFNSTFFI